MFRRLPTAYLITAPSAESANIEERLRIALDTVSVELVDPDEVRSQTLRGSDIADALDRADMVIADVSASNPNVMFELGVARGARKPILVLSQDNAELPRDVLDLQVITYQPGDTQKVMDFVTHWAQEQIKQFAD